MKLVMATLNLDYKFSEMIVHRPGKSIKRFNLIYWPLELNLLYKEKCSRLRKKNFEKNNFSGQ